MISQGSNPITSEDYADLIINYSGDQNILNAFDNSTVDIINYIYALVQIPVVQVTNQIIQEYGYSAMPKLYGLVSHGSLEASGILRIRNIPNFNFRGNGVLIGIIDTGIDYTNPVFRNADGTTRIVSIWDQTIEGAPPRGMAYGSEYTREQIDQALQSQSPLDIVPSMDTNGHGTIVAGIAAGGENNENDFVGVAPEAEIVVVKLKPAKSYLKRFFYLPDEALCFQENDILYAINYLLNKAYEQKKPMSICLALGTSQGGHSGRGVLSNYLSITAGTASISVTVAGGNEGNARRHYIGMVNEATRYDSLELNVGENESGFSMELWGQAPSIFSIDILSPSGEYIPRIAVGMDENREISFVFEQTVIYVDYQMVEAQTGDQLVLMRFDKPTQGIWRFNVYERGDFRMNFNVWLPMGSFISENTFFLKSDPYTTILGPGNAETPMTVTAYNYEDNSIYTISSRGYTRLGSVKPNVAAPGVNLQAPTLDKGFAFFSGTSTSAAHTAGVAAMLLEWGIVRGNLAGMSTIEIKKLILRGAKRDLNIVFPNRDWGYGILDLYNVFDSLRGGVVV